ncbi:MAG: hypothetical protein AAF548_12395 [Actinomycetota bacterium]
MEPTGPPERGPAPVSWDEAREVVALVLTVCAASVAIGAVFFRLVDGQLDRDGVRSALQGATSPSTGLIILGAGLIVATTPAQDVAPRLRQAVNVVAMLILVLAVLHIVDLLFAETAGGVRRFFTRFGTIAWRPLPTALIAGCAGWLARRVVPFPGG